MDFRGTSDSSLEEKHALVSDAKRRWFQYSFGLFMWNSISGDFADVKIPAGSIWHNHCCSSRESSPHTTGIFNSTSINKHPNHHEGSFVIHQGICHQVFFLHKRSGDALTRAGTVFRKPAKNALSDGYRLFKLLCLCPFSTPRWWRCALIHIGWAYNMNNGAYVTAFWDFPKEGPSCVKILGSLGSQNASGLGCFKFSLKVMLTQGQSLFPLKATAFLRSVATFMVIMPLRTKMHRIHPHAKKRIHLVPWKISWCKTRSGRSSSTNTVSFSKKEID